MDGWELQEAQMGSDEVQEQGVKALSGQRQRSPASHPSFAAPVSMREAGRLPACPRDREPWPPGASAWEKIPARHLLPSEPSPLLQCTHWAGLAVRCNLGKREGERG